MLNLVPITNKSMDLSECAGCWTLDEKAGCWCLEDILYTPKARVPKFQRLSIFVPQKLRRADGSFTEEAARTPIVFENNAAGYMQMPHVWLDGPRCYAHAYLKHGLIYVSCGCRGRESRDARGGLTGKGPSSLIDLKTAIRFLRRNRANLPGDFERIISVGWSAGGAMSTLLGVTGDHPAYRALLEENGAFMDESDAVFASQIYCPIVDLEHADLAYEWMFRADKTCENSPAGPAETMTPFKEALSAALAEAYIPYFNGLGLKHPQTGEPLTFNADGRSGSAYDYLMGLLEDSAGEYLRRLETGRTKESFSVSDYLCGHYTHKIPAPPPAKPDPAMHHAGPGLALDHPPLEGKPPFGKPPPPSLGDLVSRPPKGMPAPLKELPTIEVPGDDKSQWLDWDGKRAKIRDLDSYILGHRRRMKPCTAFDKLTNDSGENQAFGTPQADFMHFSPDIAPALERIKAQFPAETAPLLQAYAAVDSDEALARRVWLYNPMHFIADKAGKHAGHYRIRVGASDADTAFTVSMALALKLQNEGAGTVDYALVWDQPHSEADYPGEVCKWIDQICDLME